MAVRSCDPIAASQGRQKAPGAREIFLLQIVHHDLEISKRDTRLDLGCFIYQIGAQDAFA